MAGQEALTLQAGLSSHGAGPKLIPPPTPTVEGGKALHLWQIFLNLFIYFNWRIITLQYCGFCHTSRESATGLMGFFICKMETIILALPWKGPMRIETEPVKFRALSLHTGGLQAANRASLLTDDQEGWGWL